MHQIPTTFSLRCFTLKGKIPYGILEKTSIIKQPPLSKHFEKGGNLKQNQPRDGQPSAEDKEEGGKEERQNKTQTKYTLNIAVVHKLVGREKK